MRTIELCAGIGGFSSPHTNALAYVEIEPTCRAVLRRHYPDALILSDVRECGAHNLPRADVIKFGFPCQDLSVAGNRAGLSGARSGLFYECTRIVNELQPNFCLWENVPGLLSSDDGRDFMRVLMELERIGFAGGWTSLDAQWFGVAQRRQRIFGLFARRDIGAERCAEILSLAARLPWNTTQGGAKRARVAAAIARSAGHHGRSSPRGDGSDNLISFAFQSGGDCRLSITEDGTPAKQASQVYAVAGFGGYTDGHPTLRASGGDRGGGSEALVAATLNSDGNNGGFRTEPGEHIVVATRDVAPALTQNYGKQADNSDTNLGPNVVMAFTERTRTEGRTLEAQDDLAYALTNPGSGGRTHSRQIAGGFGVRRLTPTECERLQGFEDDWTAWGIDEQDRRIEMSDSVRYRMLGNAVNRKVSAWFDARLAFNAPGELS